MLKRWTIMSAQLSLHMLTGIWCGLQASLRPQGNAAEPSTAVLCWLSAELTSCPSQASANHNNLSHNLNHQLLLGQPETAPCVCLARERSEMPIHIQWDLCAEAAWMTQVVGTVTFPLAVFYCWGTFCKGNIAAFQNNTTVIYAQHQLTLWWRKGQLSSR